MSTRSSLLKGTRSTRVIGASDCWTIGQVAAAVENSASSNRTVHISRDDGFFKGYKSVVTELYKNLTGIQQYQWFAMDAAKPGVVECKKSPSASPVEQDLRRKVDGIFTEDTKVHRMFTHFLEPLDPPPPLNAEKRQTMHVVVRPYVPDEFQSDPMYAAPTSRQGLAAKAAKQSRREHRAAMTAAAKANQGKRGRDDGNEECDVATAKKKKSVSHRCNGGG